MPKYMLIMRPTAEAELWAKDVPFEDATLTANAREAAVLRAKADAL